MTLDADRRQWEEQSSKLLLPAGTDVSVAVIAGVDCLLVSDKNSTNGKVIIYLHGGGLVAGSVLTHRHYAACLTKATACDVLLLDYRLLPEHQYPAPLEDLLSVYRALLAGDTYSANDIFFGGDSSGGGLALAALVVLRDSGIPLPHLAFTISGTFDMSLSGESMLTGKSNVPDMSFSELKKWQQNYLDFELNSPLLSPVYAELSNLPPLLILAAGLDPWLSDSETVAQKVRASGGNVRLRVWDSMDHVWVMDSSLSESQEAMLEIVNFLNQS